MFRTAPYIPPIESSNASNSQNFDNTLLNMELLINDENDIDSDQEWEQTDQEPTDGENSIATPSPLRSSQDVTEHSILAEPINSTVVTARHEEPTPERKTLETRPTALPPSTLPSKRSSLAVKPELPQIDTILKPVSVADATPRGGNETTVPTSRLPTIPVKAVADAAAAASTGPVIHRKGPKKVLAPKPHAQRPNRQRIRRKKPGEAVLVLGISDASDEDEVRTERDEEEGFIEADGEERNWAGVDSLSAREVVDRYRLAVSRKGSTPNLVGPDATGNLAGLSATIDGPNSPNPLAKEHRSLFGALPFRRTSKNFLLTKSPPTTSTRSSLSLGASLRASGLSGTTTSTVPSFHTARTSLGQPSFKSRESDVSVGNYGSSSHALTSGNSRAAYMRKNLL